MAMSRATELREIWSSIASPPRGSLAGRRIPSLGTPFRVWAAIDSARTPHLLVQVPPETGSMAIERTRGLEVAVDEMRIGTEPTSTYLSLACLDENLIDTFSALCGDVAAALDRGAGDPVATAKTVIQQWRRFWQISGGRLSREECLGLFGELWFMERWVGLPRAVKYWTAPQGARHDFQCPAWSVEVKTGTRGADGLVRHTIGGIEQLADPESGDLYLFSLQVATDELASNMLPTLVERIAETLTASPGDRGAFLDGLSSRGYNPAESDKYPFRWRILAEELYRVEGDFPRIVSTSFSPRLPAAIGPVVYGLDMAACAAWRVANTQAASIDFHIGQILLPDSRESASRRIRSDGPRRKEEHSLSQGETAVIVTSEAFNLPGDIAAITFPPSHVAFRGLLVTNPGHIDPGYSGPMRFTAINMAKEPFLLRTGDDIATVVFMRMNEPATRDWGERNPGRSVAVDSESVDRLSSDFLDVEARAKEVARDVGNEQRWMMFGVGLIPSFLLFLGILLSTVVTAVFSDWWPPASRQSLLDASLAASQATADAKERAAEAIEVSRELEASIERMEARLSRLEAASISER